MSSGLKQLRILHVDKFLRRQGGAATYMLDVAEAQRRRGHEVSFFSMRHPENIADPNEDLFPPLVQFDTPDQSIGDRVAVVRTMLWSRKAETGMQRMVERFRPDVVHVHNIYHQLSPSILAPLRRSGTPVVMTVHDFKLICPTYRMLDGDAPCQACIGGHFHHALRGCSGSRVSSALMGLETAVHRVGKSYDPVGHFIVPSAFLEGLLRTAEVFPTRLRRIPHFVRPVPDAGPRDGSLLYVGRLSREKGVDVLIEAMGSVPSVVLHVVGDGPERADLERRAQAIAPGRVQFHGLVDRQGVTAHQLRSSLGVLPARYFENQPMSILEAFGAGLAMISTDLGGVPELVVPGETGALVAPDDVAALAAGINSLLADPVALARMGMTARKWVQKHHDLDEHLTRLEAVYNECVRQ